MNLYRRAHILSHIDTHTHTHTQLKLYTECMVSETKAAEDQFRLLVSKGGVCLDPRHHQAHTGTHTDAQTHMVWDEVIVGY
jgi:hypothetical protein